MATVSLAAWAGCDAAPTPPARSNRPIVGGTPAAGDPAVLPFAPRLSGCQSAPDVYCTGTIIAPRAVLTAAHCVADEPLASILIDGAEAEAVYLHPDGDDIAVVVLARPVTTSPAEIRRAPMGASEIGSQVRLVGWGIDDAGMTGTKREGTATISAVEGRSFDIEPGPAMSCGGDSGGPAFIAGEIAGVVSFGDAECLLFGGNTRVDAYATDFIDPTLAAIAALPEAPARPVFDPELDYCETACAGDVDCPRGMGCVAAEGGMRCALAGGDVGVFQGTCDDDDGCAEGACISGIDGDTCRCFLRCELRSPEGCCSGSTAPGISALLVVLLFLGRRHLTRLGVFGGVAMLLVSGCVDETATPTGPVFADIAPVPTAAGSGATAPPPTAPSHQQRADTGRAPR